MAQRYCTNCGGQLAPEDRFCSGCGRPTQETARVATPEADKDVPPPPSSGPSFAPTTAGSATAPAENKRVRNLVLFLLAVIGVFAVLGSLVGGTDSGESGGGQGAGGVGNGGGDDGAAAPAASGETFTKDNYGELFSDPDAHKGAAVNVTGQLLGVPEQDGDQIYFQMFADSVNVEWNTVVAADDPGTSLNADDYVRVRGSVRGSFKGENAFGGDVRAVAVDADSVEKVDPTEAVDPTEKSVTVNRTASDQGFSVTVEKVEFAEKSTRVYVTATNDTNRKADFYTFDAKIVQGSRQVDQETPFDYEVREPQSTLQPGVRTEGIVAFGPVNPSAPFALSFEWSSYNYNVVPKPIRFRITP